MNSLDVLYDVIDEQDDSVSRTELLNIAKRSGKRLQNLINSILDISWLETGQAMLKTQATDPAPLLREAVEFVSPQAEVGEIDLSASFAETLPQVEIDSDMILRVILNLLDNAIKFTQVGGKVNLTATVVDTAIEVAIADNGPGIPPSQIPTIFEKFTRVRRENGPKGTGLGLTFCHLAVKAHGGNIWVESKLGRGTTFRFTLPIFREKKEEDHPKITPP
jgi:signal transduction histidine kinase